MAITYTRTTLGNITDLSASAASGGSLSQSTQFWFLIIPLTSTTYTTNSIAVGAPSNIVTASTDTTNLTINLSWSVVSGTGGYLIYWTKVDPGTDPTAFNSTGYVIKDSAGTSVVSVLPGSTTSFSFSTEQAAGSPKYNIPWNDTYRFPAIYNDNVDYIFISGTTDSDRGSFEKLYQHCVSAGWDSVQKTHDRAYYVKANIAINTGGIFESKNELIYTIGNFYNTSTNSVTYFGTGTNELDSENGATWISLGGQGSSWASYFSVNKIRAFNFQFRVIRQGNLLPLTGYARYSNFYFGGDYQIANCTFDCLQYLVCSSSVSSVSGSFMTNVTVYNSRWAYQIQQDMTAATLTNIISIGSIYAAYIRYSPTIRGFNHYGAKNGFAILINQFEDIQVRLIDSNLVWNAAGLFQWYNNGRMATGNEYVKNLYTVTITVVDKNNTPISGASVIINDTNGIERMNVVTNSSGIASYEMEAGVHKSNATSAVNNGSYTNHNPFTMTITKSGFKKYKSKFTFSQKLTETITLDKVLVTNIAGPVQSWQ